jgi:hypothetical protein
MLYLTVWLNTGEISFVKRGARLAGNGQCLAKNVLLTPRSRSSWPERAIFLPACTAKPHRSRNQAEPEQISQIPQKLFAKLNQTPAV